MSHAYKRLQKTYWRRRVWNKLAKLAREAFTASQLQELPCLYMAGKFDLDREVAAKKGFNPQLMVAVDLDQEAVKSVRLNGGLAVQCGAAECIANLSWRWPFAVVCLDFQGGYSWQNVRAMYALESVAPLWHRPLVALNFMRGRDESSNVFREYSKRIISLAANAPIGDEVARECLVPRGSTLAEFAFSNRAGLAICQAALHHADAIYDQGILECREAATRWSLATFLESADFFSYRSGRLKYDSVVLRWPLNFNSPGVELVEFKRLPSHVARRMAALKSLMTRRGMRL